MHKCYEEHELRDVAERKMQNHYPQPPEPLWAPAADSHAPCPVELYQHQLRKDVQDRSVSPWRLV